MSIDALLTEIEGLPETYFDEPRGVETLCRSDVIAIINKHMTGMVLVPVEPDAKMITAGINCIDIHSTEFDADEDVYQAYKAMITASQGDE